MASDGDEVVDLAGESDEDVMDLVSDDEAEVDADGEYLPYGTSRRWALYISEFAG